MGIRKENDWVGINLSNPGFTNTDFKDAELLYDDDGEVGCIIYRMKRVENEV